MKIAGQVFMRLKRSYFWSSTMEYNAGIYITGFDVVEIEYLKRKM